MGGSHGMHGLGCFLLFRSFCMPSASVLYICISWSLNRYNKAREVPDGWSSSHWQVRIDRMSKRESQVSTLPRTTLTASLFTWKRACSKPTTCSRLKLSYPPGISLVHERLGLQNCSLEGSILQSSRPCPDPSLRTKTRWPMIRTSPAQTCSQLSRYRYLHEQI